MFTFGSVLRFSPKYIWSICPTPWSWAAQRARAAPARKSDSVQSRVTIPDGSTVVVGGLNRRNFSQTKDAVPILGQLPVLEYLFSSRTTNDANTTLFVFIRPVILRDDKFEDLKFLSERDAREAGVPADFPQSEPLTIR